MRPLSFSIIGAGWRALFYVRIARQYPQWFTLQHVVCRTAGKAQQLHREYGVPTTDSEQVCLAARPDFVVVAVHKNANFAVTRHWLELGCAVLAETPAACSEEELEALWALHKAGARLMIAEQYFRYPLIDAGLQAVQAGLLGTPHAVTLSLAHDYHAASLLRRMLGYTHLPAFTAVGQAYTWGVEQTDSRQGPVTDGSVRQSTRSLVTLQFADGKAAFYDFDGVQYHSFIRSRHINVQGDKGEWNDTLLRYVDAAHHPVQQALRPRLDPTYAALHTPELAALCERWQPAVHMEPWQDEYAIATLMADMADLIDHGWAGYPLAEALEDAATWLIMDAALKHPGQKIPSHRHSWQETE